MLCCGYTLTDFPISIRLPSLALWQSNDCLSASKATLKNMDKYFTWIHYERLHNHNKAKHNKTVCIFLGIYCIIITRFSHIDSLSHSFCLRFAASVTINCETREISSYIDLFGEDIHHIWYQIWTLSFDVPIYPTMIANRIDNKTFEIIKCQLYHTETIMEIGIATPTPEL